MARTMAAGSPEAQARNRLRHLKIKAVKGLGQHFLIERSVIETIIDAADLSPSDLVLEVGPGLGILTEELVLRT